MTEKELRELRRRFRPERNNITRLKGCFVNGEGRIVSRITQSMLTGESSVSERLLGVMKKAVSGQLGTNLTEVEYSTKQVSESPRHALLMRLRESELNDEEALDALYSAITASLKLDSGYVILLAHDVYDVPSYSKDGAVTDSYERFSYIVGAIVRIKQLPEAITLREADSTLHLLNVSGALGSCELGFTFPTFDDRRTNIYGALLYKRSLCESYADFCEQVLDSEAKLPPAYQRTAFGECLSASLDKELSLDVVRELHTQIAELEENHKQQKTGEVLTVSSDTLKTMLECCGVGEEKLTALTAQIEESFGTNALLNPKNIVKTNRFEVKTPEVSVKVDPEHRDLVSTQTIDKVKYLMIRVTSGVEVNGINIRLDEE